MITPKAKRPIRRTAGFTLLELMLTMALMSIILTVLGSAIMMHAKASARLAQKRVITNHAEAVLIDLQLGREIDADDQGRTVKIDVLTDPEAPAGRRWVRVTVAGQHTNDVLVGLVPAANLPEGSP